MQYTEIFKLKEMLEKENIPFLFIKAYEDSELLQGFQIFYPKGGHGNWLPETVCSVIQNGGSYGHEQDLLEIMGLLTDEELHYNTVKGWLTAKDVFQRIQNHYKGVMNNENATEIV